MKLFKYRFILVNILLLLIIAIAIIISIMYTGGFPAIWLMHVFMIEVFIWMVIGVYHLLEGVIGLIKAGSMKTFKKEIRALWNDE